MCGGGSLKVVDTSALYALFMADDAHHRQAREELARGEPWLIPSEILAEATWLIQRRAGFEASAKAIGELRKLPTVEVQPTLDDPQEDILASAWLEYRAAKGRLSYPDAVVVAWCRRRRLKPVTFDRELAKAVQG